MSNLLKQVPDSHCLFGTLAENKPFCNWIRIDFLETIAIASGKQNLENLVKRYKSAIFSKPLNEVWNCVSHTYTKQKYYTEVKGKFDLDPEKVTVEELLKREPKLAKEIELHIAEIQEGSVLVTWLIPTMKVYQAYLSFLTISQQSRLDVFMQFGTWKAFLPQFVLQEQRKEQTYGK